MRRIPLATFQEELRAQGVSRHEDYAFRCPVCRTIQSGASLLRAMPGSKFDDIERYLAFSCIGRLTAAGPHKKGAKPGNGCDWTLGGLFTIHELLVVTPDDVEHPRFELATPAEAQALAADNAAAGAP